MSSSVGWQLLATGLFLAALGIVVAASHRWMFDELQVYPGGHMAVALWLAIPVLVAAYGFGIPIVVTSVVHHARPGDFPYLLCEAIARTGYAPYIMLALVVYGTWGAALWWAKLAPCMNIKRGFHTT